METTTTTPSPSSTTTLDRIVQQTKAEVVRRREHVSLTEALAKSEREALSQLEAFEQAINPRTRPRRKRTKP